MSDPKKNFICPICGLISNDGNRRFGTDTKCINCMIENRNINQELENNNE